VVDIETSKLRPPRAPLGYRARGNGKIQNANRKFEAIPGHIA
jgi:hypothetical protein